MTQPNSKTVRAWTYKEPGYPDCLRLTTTISVPLEAPTPHHVIIKPYAVSLNPVDIQAMNLPREKMSSSEKIVAKDFSGEVIAAGERSGFVAGDQIMGLNLGVAGTGFLAELVALDLSHQPSGGATVTKKPKHLDWVQAASLPVAYLTAHTSISSVQPWMTATTTTKDNKLVVLGGSSGTGIYTINLAKRKGWTVLATCSGKNVDFVKSLGADQVADYTTATDAVTTAVKAFQPHAIIDCVGGTETIGLARRYVTIVGDKTSRSTMGGPYLYASMFRMRLRWAWGRYGLGNPYDCIMCDGNVDYLRDVENLKARDVIIDTVFDFDQAKEAYERLNTGRAKGKVVVKVVG